MFNRDDYDREMSGVGLTPDEDVMAWDDEDMEFEGDLYEDFLNCGEESE